VIGSQLRRPGELSSHRRLSAPYGGRTSCTVPVGLDGVIGREKMRVSPKRWWEYAERDLETARVLLRAQQWDAASLFAQQAVEKAFKALLVQASGELPPRVHDLIRLAELVRMPEELFPELDELSRVYRSNALPGRHSCRH